MKAGMHKVAAIKSIANGLSRALISKLQGGSFKRTFLMSVGSFALRALYAKVSTIKNYNEDGKPHLLVRGKLDVGKQLPSDYWDDPSHFDKNGDKIIPFSSDQSTFMNTVAKGPYMDAFAEFHDGLHSLSFMPNDQISLIVTMPPSYTLTVTAAMQPYVGDYMLYKNLRRK